MKIFFRILVLTLTATACVPQVSLAQKEFNVWHFGGYAGIDFNSGTPVSVPGGQINTLEGCASICDDNTGQILFYTDGSAIWNRNDLAMPNGLGLLGNFSSTQSALIVGDPASPNRYYVFTSDQGGYVGPTNKGVNYSIVDMTLDGGMGDVTTKNVLLLDSATEKLTAVRQPNSCNTWILAHQFNSNAFSVWQLNDTGLNPTPVVSNVGVVQTGDPYETIGYLVSSADGTRLAQALNFSGNVELLDFDATTGIVSNAITLGGFTNPYGVSFSPDGSMLYVSEYLANDLLQLDITSNVVNTILSSKYEVEFGDACMAIMPGPDGKLYVACSGRTYVGVIAAPNSAGVACNFNSQSVVLQSGRCNSGLPNIPYTFMNAPSHSCLLPSVKIASVPTVCVGDCISPSDTVSGAVSYAWELVGSQAPLVMTANPGMVCYDSAGVFEIKLTITNGQGSQAADSTFVTVVNPVAVTLEAVGGRTDTIGGEVAVPLNIVQGGTFAAGTLSFMVGYDTSNMQFAGFYSDSIREDDSDLDSIGEAFVTLDSAEIVNRTQLGYALFQLLPVSDSCMTVSFDSIRLSTVPKQCLILDGNSGNSGVSATVCAPIGCGTAILSQLLRTGRMPVWSVAEIDPHRLQLNYQHFTSGATLTIYDALGRPLARANVPSGGNATMEINLPNSANGNLFVQLRLESGAVETRGVFVAP